MRRILVILFVPLVLVGLLFAFVELYARPELSRWALAKIESLTVAEGPVVVRARSLDIGFLKPGVELQEITVTPKEGQLLFPQPIKIRSARLRLDAFDLLFGRLELAALIVDGLEVSLKLDPLLGDKSPPEKLPTDKIFGLLEKVPLRRLILTNSLVTLNADDPKLAAEIDVSSVVVQNRVKSVAARIQAPRIRMSALGAKDLELAASADLEADAKTLGLKRFEVRQGGLKLEARGQLDDLPNVALAPKAQMALTANLDLESVRGLLKELLPKEKIPTIEGQVDAHVELEWKGEDRLQSKLRVQTKNVSVASLEIGDASLQGTVTPKEVALDEIRLKHPSGQATLKKSRLELRAPFNFSSEIEVPSLDLQALFKSLDLNEIPVWSTLKGQLPCRGTIDPLSVDCNGDVSSPGIVVKGGMGPKEDVIVSLKDLATEGTVHVDMDAVTFQTKLRVGQSKGETKGRVGFKDGFKIDFKTPDVRFADVDNLANLEFEGAAAIEGFTRGDSDAATFDLKVGARNFVFEGYRLGQVDGNIKYRSGKLLFDDLVVSLPRSRATGGMEVDLRGKKLAGLVEANLIDIGDVATVFDNLVHLPIEVQAPGRARVEFSGPLDFWKMSYKLDADFRNGKIQGDSFDTLELRAAATDGEMKIEKAILKKNASTIVMKGGITSAPEYNLTVDVSGLRLEESELINRVRNNIAGVLTMNCEIHGKVDSPDLKFKGTLSDIYVDEQEIPSSFFRFHLNKDAIEGESTLFGNKIQGELLWPLGKDGGPFRLRLKTTDWNFTSLLSLIGASALQSEYESHLTAELDLHSDNGSIQNSSGRIHIGQLSLKRGPLNLHSPKPIAIEFDKGLITMKDFRLVGEKDETGIALAGEGFRLDRLNVQVQANSDLRLVHLFLPFLEDLGGPFRISATVTGAIGKPQILGNASIDDAFVKLKGFPHPLEKLNAEILFSQSKILVQSLKGQMAGGQVAGEGSVQINGFGDVPTQIRIRGEGLTLAVPDKVRTSGNADLLFSGKWFPFVLSGTYNVQSALVEKDFGGGEGTANAPKVSSYLPKILRQANFDPVILDLQIQLERNIVVRNSQMDGQVTGQLQVKGPPQDPILLGRIVMERGSKIIVRDKVFDLLTGIITFNNPEEINPDLYISAQMRLNDYDINVLAQGPAKTLTIRLTSVPPLPESDIISLLALGVTSSNLSSRDQNNQVGVEALGFVTEKTGVKKGLESTLGVNVQLTNVYDTTKNISVPKVSFSKRLGSRVNASVARPLNSEGAQEVKIQYQINKNVSAIGSYEERNAQTTTLPEATSSQRDVFGLDLEFKREFK